MSSKKVRNNSLIVFFSLIITACAQNEIQSIDYSEKKIATPEEFPEIAVQNLSIYNGKVKFVSLDASFITKKPKSSQLFLKCRTTEGKESIYRGILKNKNFGVYISESYFSKPHVKKCYLQKEHVLTLAVESFPYKRESLNVPKKKIDLSKKDLDRVIEENKVKKEIYKYSSPEYFYNKPFRVPLKSKITSYYGNQRIFNDKKKSQHLGNDLRAAVGVKIPATNTGKVIFTGHFFFSGKLVVIDHGLDIFTVYMHLSKILVEKGDIVSQGEVVGLAGRTGRVSGPHLHWGMKVAGNWIDSFAFVKQSRKQFTAP